MISCLWLERPGAWRLLGMGAILSLAVLPALPLLWQVVSTNGSESFGSGFGIAVWNSLTVALLVCVIALVSGLSVGVLSALYEFPGRQALLALAMLPALVPSFLWAIGWSSVASRIGPTATGLISGLTGCALTFLATAFPLVLITAYVATLGLSGSQIDGARLAGGEMSLLRYACRAAAIPAMLAAGLAAILTLSDPGPGQILGLRTAASEVLTSFSSLYDFHLAGKQCVVLSGLVLVLAAPLVWLAAPRLSVQMMARQSRPLQRLRHGPAAVGITSGLMLLLAGMVCLPVLGLLLPLLHGAEFSRTSSTVARTGINTLLYAGGAGGVAVTLGLLLALFVGRNNRLRTICLGICLALLALPSTLAALGIIQLAGNSPAWTDPLLRSRATVCIVLGLRYVPVAVVLAMRAWQSMPASWVETAGIHGLPLGLYTRKVVIPFLLPSCAAAFVLTALLATADVGTVLLVHPPGQASLPLAIFTVMANAPESLVASLCLVYLGLAAGLLMVLWTAAQRPRQ